ncbi:hypothetical protein [Halobaculum sp. D14]|uniref:hypothetical protein n=1 Tax=unclassified Halobaculum TaxID=2640896 RepID=UPI003EBDE146
MTDTPVSDLRDEIERIETAYEFLISFAGQGVGREAVQSPNDQVRKFVSQFEEALGAGFDAATAVPDEHDQFDTETYERFTATMADEVEEARTVLSLLGEQDKITSRQADNLNGMSVFQSVLMKFFFLDELTNHLERPDGDAEDADADADGVAADGSDA